MAQFKAALDDFSSKWSKSYKHLIESWLNDEDLFTYYKYPVSMRKSIYTTNWIERFNKEVRRLNKTKILYRLRMHVASLFITKLVLTMIHGQES